MKRAMGGGAHRGPVGIRRQRRTIRFVQILLAIIGAGIVTLGGLSVGDDGGRSVVLVIFGVIAIVVAVMLQRSGLSVPTPVRLDELTGRAEGAAVERASRIAEEQRKTKALDQDPRS